MDKRYVVFGASGNGEGDMDCGISTFPTLDDACCSIYDEMVENCGGEYQDWMPCFDIIQYKMARGEKLVIPMSQSGANYDYCWRMIRLGGEGERDTNKFGVPYHSYRLILKDGTQMDIDVGCEDDWGNIQHCWTDWSDALKEHCKECVGWGCEDEWTEVTMVIDNETDKRIDPLTWAKNEVWVWVDKYSS